MNADAKFLPIEKFNEKLEQWQGKEIKISKVELNDLDEVYLVLDRITYDKETRRLDDYVPLYSIELHGSGLIETDFGEQPLPEAAYEVPLNSQTLFEFEDGVFIISTDRGAYKIERAE